MIQITSNASSAAAAVAGVGARTMARAFAHSANSAVSSTRTYLLRALQDQGMKRKDVVGNLFINRADVSNLNANMKDRGRRIPLAAFNPRAKTVKTARGPRIGVTITSGVSRDLVPGGFLVTMKSGKQGIFQRVGDQRLPIRQLFARRINEIVKGTDGLQAGMNAVALESFNTNFKRDFEFYKAKEKGHA